MPIIFSLFGFIHNVVCTGSYVIIIIIITLLKSQIILAKHKGSTTVNQIIKSIKSIKSNQIMVFEERGKLEYPEKNLSKHFGLFSSLHTRANRFRGGLLLAVMLTIVFSNGPPN